MITARDILIAAGGKWPDELPTEEHGAALATAQAIEQHMVELGPVSRRIMDAEQEPDFLRVLEVCKGCLEFNAEAMHCNGCKTCGGGSVKGRWANRSGCPLGKWTAS